MVSFLGAELSLPGKEMLSQTAKPGLELKFGLWPSEKGWDFNYLKNVSDKGSELHKINRSREKKLHWIREINVSTAFADQLLSVCVIKNKQIKVEKLSIYSLAEDSIWVQSIRIKE